MHVCVRVTICLQQVVVVWSEKEFGLKASEFFGMRAVCVMAVIILFFYSRPLEIICFTLSHS